MATQDEIRAKDILPHKTSFSAGDGFYGDGDSSFFMEADDLLRLTAENAVGVHKTNSGTITANKYDIVSIHAPVGTTLTIKIATSSNVNLVANGSTVIAYGKNSGTYQYTTTTENTNIGFYLYGAHCTYSLDVLYGEVYESIRELQNDAVAIHNEIGNTIHETGTITTSAYNIAVLSTKIGDVVNVKVDTSSSVNLVMNGTIPIAYGITSGVYKFIATSTTTSVGFYLYDASCTYTLDVVAGSNIKNDVIELGYADDNLQNQIGTKIEKTGTITSSTYNIVTIKTKVGDAVNIKITTSSAVNLVANTSTIIATSVTSGTYKFVATSTTTNIGFFLYGASCDYTIDVVAGDNLRNEIIELGYVDRNLQSQIGQRVEKSGTITASDYNIATISTKTGDLVNIQVDTSSPVNLVANGNVILAYGITGSHKYQFTSTSGTTSVGFYLYDASCTYEMKVTAGNNLNNDISDLEKSVYTLGITKTLKTKELLVLGDSISVSHGYFSYLKTYFAKANTVAVPGATWSDHSDTDAYNGTPTSDVAKYNVMGNQVQKVKNNSSSYNPDFIILSAGTNDATPDSDYPSEDLFTHNDSYVSLGTPTFDANDTYMLNRRTIGGAMRYCITELEKLYPNAKIIVLTPIQASNSLRAYWTITRRQSYISSTAHRMASFVADVGKNCGIYGDFEWQGSSWTEIEPDSREGRDLSDGLHPNDSGRKKMSDYIFSQICTMVS